MTPNHRLQLTGASGAALRGGLIGKRNVEFGTTGSSPAAEAGPLGATKDEVVHSKAIATLERFNKKAEILEKRDFITRFAKERWA